MFGNVGDTIYERWFRRAHKRKTFIEHIEKRLQHCVEAIEADTSINQIIQRMKSLLVNMIVYIHHFLFLRLQRLILFIDNQKP